MKNYVLQSDWKGRNDLYYKLSTEMEDSFPKAEIEREKKKTQVLWCYQELDVLLW